jgi:NAD(P)-dependent dehydrogenase (short-subunit alcohol dehydrogenase family)
MAASQQAALVTGGAKGIGHAIASYLLDTNWRTGVVDLPNSGLEQTYCKNSRDVVLIEGDVAKEETAERAATAVVDAFGRLDALVSTLAEWRRVIAATDVPQG